MKFCKLHKIGKHKILQMLPNLANVIRIDNYHEILPTLKGLLKKMQTS